MMEDESDLNLDLLEKLMQEAENADKTEDTKDEVEPEDFASILENLDTIPVKIPQRDSLKTVLKNDKGKPMSNEGPSLVHSGDTDSEDDEEKKYFHEKRYNEYGSSIKKLLESSESSEGSRFRASNNGCSKSWKSTTQDAQGSLCAPTTKVKQIASDLDVDKLIGVRVINPLVSSVVLSDRLNGRKVVPFSTIKNFTSRGKISEDWVVIGVIVSKAPPRTSAKGSTYSIIKLSDLRGLGDMKTVSLFLFSGACKTHSKNSVGTVIGILNPNIFDNSKSHGDEASLSVDSADKIMVVGASRDFGLCKSKKKNGENCTSFVNKACCEYCVYHVKQEYQQCSRRTELQSSFTGKGLIGGLNGLRNKVLGKSEVFYAGQSFTAVPAKKNNKLSSLDNQRLSILSGSSVGNAPVKQVQGKKRLASSVELSHRQMKKDLDRLKKLDALGIGTAPVLADQRPVLAVSSQNYCEQLKVEDTKKDTLAFISNIREKEAAKAIITNSPSAEKNLYEQSPKNHVVSDPEKTPTQISRGAAFAVTAKEKNSKTSNRHAPSAFGLGGKFSKNSNLSSTFLARDLQETTRKSDDENIMEAKINPPKKIDSISPTRSPVESKILAKMMEQRAVKIEPKVETDLTIMKASEFGLGRGRVVQSKSSVKKVAPTLSSAVPVLGAGISPKGKIEFDLSVNLKPCRSMMGPNTYPKAVNSKPQGSKLKALSYVRRNGLITKEDPNKLELSNKKKVSLQGSKRSEPTKRKIEEALNNTDEARKKKKNEDNEKQKGKMAEFKALMEITSKHVDLVEKADSEAQEEYFDKLEKKEKMEEKMLNTYKVACKAVTCLKCKYTAFSAADICKEERHPLKVSDATKRFFKCADCGNRTCCLEIIPIKTCSNCNGSKWERTSMVRERKVRIGSETLSIRGGEEKFIGSDVTGANLNLFVPE